MCIRFVERVYCRDCGKMLYELKAHRTEKCGNALWRSGQRACTPSRCQTVVDRERKDELCDECCRRRDDKRRADKKAAEQRRKLHKEIWV